MWRPKVEKVNGKLQHESDFLQIQSKSITRDGGKVRTTADADPSLIPVLACQLHAMSGRRAMDPLPAGGRGSREDAAHRHYRSGTSDTAGHESNAVASPPGSDPSHQI